MRRRIDPLSGERLLPGREQALQELRADIVRAAYVEGDFVLAGGIRRDYYLDKYLFETKPAILRRLGRFLAGMIPAEVDRLAAPALGAVALGTTVSLELGLPLVMVRPEALRGPGEASRGVEGELYEGEKVALIEDVVVSGSRALQAAERLTAAGGRTVCVVAVVDRQEGAAARLAEAAIEYRPLFTPEMLAIGEESSGTL